MRRKMKIVAVILTAGLMFMGGTNASANLLSNGSFEDGSPTSWDDGATATPPTGGDSGYNEYSHATQIYYSGPAPAGCGDTYGWAWGLDNGDGMFGSAMQIADVSGIAGGAYTFSAWMAAYTSDSDYAEITLEFFDGAGGTGNSLGSSFFDGGDGASAYIVGSADAAGLADPTVAWVLDNWTLYEDNGTVPGSALSATVTISSNALGTYGSANGNDAYVDLVTLVPEPMTLSLLGLGGLALLRRRR